MSTNNCMMKLRKLSSKEIDSMHRLLEAGIKGEDKRNLVLAEAATGGNFEELKKAAYQVGSTLIERLPSGGAYLLFPGVRMLNWLMYFAIEDAQKNSRVEWLEVAYESYRGAGAAATLDGLRLRYLIDAYFSIVVKDEEKRLAHLDSALAAQLQMSRMEREKGEFIRGCYTGHHRRQAAQQLGINIPEHKFIIDDKLNTDG